jgi:hypothetical protein
MSCYASHYNGLRAYLENHLTTYPDFTSATIAKDRLVGRDSLAFSTHSPAAGGGFPENQINR